MIVRFKFINNLVLATLALCLISATLFMDFTSFVLELLITIVRRNTYEETSLKEILFNHLKEPTFTKTILIFVIPKYVLLTLVVIFFLLCSFLANKYGRGRSLISLAILLILTKVYRITFDDNIYINFLMFVSAFVILLTYASEISCAYLRGTIMALPFTFTIIKLCTDVYWSYEEPLLLLFLAIFAFVFILLFCEETMYFNLMKNKQEAVAKSFDAFECDCSNNCEFKQIGLIKEPSNDTIFSLSNRTVLPLFILATLFFFATTHLLVIFYILTSTPNEVSPESYSEFLFGITYLSYVAVPIIIYFVDRKILFLISFVSMLVFKTFWHINHFSGGSSLPLLPGILFNLFIASYNITQIIIWIFFVEISPTKIKVWCIQGGILSVFVLSPLVISLGLFHYYLLINNPILGIFIGIVESVFMLYLIIINSESFIVETRGETLNDIENGMESLYK